MHGWTLKVEILGKLILLCLMKGDGCAVDSKYTVLSTFILIPFLANQVVALHLPCLCDCLK